MFSLRKFSIYDSKAEAWMLPFYSPTTATGMRTFAAAVQKAGSDFNMFPADYTLFELGEWDPKTGEETPYESKKNLGLALQFIDAPLQEVG